MVPFVNSEDVIRYEGNKAKLTVEGSDDLAKSNLAYIRSQPTPVVLSKYAQKKRRNGNGPTR